MFAGTDPGLQDKTLINCDGVPVTKKMYTQEVVYSLFKAVWNALDGTTK